MGLNKVSINPIIVTKNTVMHISDYNGIIPIDTSRSSKYSEYYYLDPYQKISSNSSYQLTGVSIFERLPIEFKESLINHIKQKTNKK